MQCSEKCQIALDRQEKKMDHIRLLLRHPARSRASRWWRPEVSSGVESVGAPVATTAEVALSGTDKAATRRGHSLFLQPNIPSVRLVADFALLPS